MSEIHTIRKPFALVVYNFSKYISQMYMLDNEFRVNSSSPVCVHAIGKEYARTQALLVSLLGPQLQKSLKWLLTYCLIALLW